MTIGVIARITPLAGREQAVEDRLAQLAQDVRAEEGNLLFYIYLGDGPDGRGITIVEEYRDEAAFRTHIDAPHTVAFNAELTGMAEGGASDVKMVRPFAK
ncbi:putative quinol monooxygenase [Paracoccus sp. PARArs4]|uniref:putative quinol monooxygenase n=1 Tax=Paracoccus sp. PARArs4 TaxID=2853442 RepID=UPI0024A78B0E|nr:putative quinol monooxygenase [Paracoccus sp. PARArs4]